MFGTILKATNSFYKKGMTYCRSIYATEVMKLLAFIFEQPSYQIIMKKNYHRLRKNISNICFEYLNMSKAKHFLVPV